MTAAVARSVGRSVHVAYETAILACPKCPRMINFDQVAVVGLAGRGDHTRRSHRVLGLAGRPGGFLLLGTRPRERSTGDLPAPDPERDADGSGLWLDLWPRGPRAAEPLEEERCRVRGPLPVEFLV